MKNRDDSSYGEKEKATRLEKALRAALSTPPKPRPKGKATGKKKQSRKSGRG